MQGTIKLTDRGICGVQLGERGPEPDRGFVCQQKGGVLFFPPFSLAH
jgi:hypothetical protein